MSERRPTCPRGIPARQSLRVIAKPCLWLQSAEPRYRLLCRRHGLMPRAGRRQCVGGFGRSSETPLQAEAHSCENKEALNTSCQYPDV